MLNIRTLVSAVAVCASLGAVSAQAADPTGPFGGNIAGSVAFTTDYIFRGISQTDTHPAVQGFLEYSLPVFGDMGTAYVSAWGSNVDFNTPGSGELEVDGTVGLRGALIDKLSYDLNFIYYAYPGSDDILNYDNYDVGLKLSYDFGLAVPYAFYRYSPDYYASSGNASYFGAGATVPLPFFTDFTPALMGEVAHQNIKKNATFGTPDYTTWMLGASMTAYTLTFTAQYFDTNLKRAECFGGTDLCDERFVLTVSKSF